MGKPAGLYFFTKLLVIVYRGEIGGWGSAQPGRRPSDLPDDTSGQHPWQTSSCLSLAQTICFRLHFAISMASDIS